MVESTPVLLPTNVVPSKYTIALDVDLEGFAFDGEQTIDLKVATTTSIITMHSRELHIKTVTFKSESGAAQDVLSITYNLTQESGQSAYSVVFRFKDALPVGPAQLTMTFTGCLNDQMAGFYRSGYTDIEGKRKIMASTQFEALDARRCFPCWDEPAVKAVFEVTLTVWAHLTAFSNMPETSVTMLPPSEDKKAKKRISFAPSPKMSTYLLAFCVGEFDFVQGYSKHGVQVRVYTPPGKSTSGNFALKIAQDTLDLYDDYFKIPYPLPKLDMVAIPEFAAGAMENWGLVTYREVDLLIDSERASNAQKQRVCVVVTHELAHQWFGNLVTMQWWDDLWLNEGFACWMQNWAADQLFPEWCMWEQFVADEQASALRLDAQVSSHPIQVPIGHAEEVEEVFDMISYCKGACVVRMIEAVIGPEAFQQGLQVYMQRHAYGNTLTSDLVKAWAEAAEKNGLKPKVVEDIMSSWTGQMGFPVVSLELEGKDMLVSQEWFLADGSSPPEAKTWTVPFGAVTSTGKHQSTTFDEAQATIELLETNVVWAKVNPGQKIPIRVKYCKTQIDALKSALQDKSLPPADRAGLVSDYVALSKAGKVDFVTLCAVISAAAVHEVNYTVWSALEAAIKSIADVLSSSHDLAVRFDKKAAESGNNVSPLALMTPAAALGTAEYCNSNVVHLVSTAFEKVGWDKEDSDGHLTGLLRGLLIRMLGSYGAGPDIVAEAKRRFNLLVSDPDDPNIIPADYKTSVFKIVLKACDSEEEEAATYSKLMKMYDLATDNIEKKHVCMAFGATPSTAMKKKTLKWCLSGAIKLQDFFYPMRGVSSSGALGSDLSWAFFQENFSQIKKMLSAASPSLMNAVIGSCCGMTMTKERADEVETFFKANPLPSSSRKVSQMLEEMRTNAAWMDSIMSFLEGGTQ